MSTAKPILAALALPVASMLAFTGCAPATGSPQTGGVAVVTGHAVGEQLAVKKYTIATVKKHNKKADCWTAIGGGVYNLTGFIKKHPGGSRAIISLCGKDGTAAFRGEHGRSTKPNSTLKKYKIGVVG